MVGSYHASSGRYRHGDDRSLCGLDRGFGAIRTYPPAADSGAVQLKTPASRCSDSAMLICCHNEPPRLSSSVKTDI